MSVPQRVPADYTEFTKGLPTRENCDQANPYEMFLWMFVALPYVSGGPLLMPIDYYQFVSKRLFELGCMLTCEACGHHKEPLLKYQAPLNTDPNVWTSPGKWVPLETPDRDPRRPAQKAADELLANQQAELFRELYRRHTPEERRALMSQVESETDGQS